jgi:hypothetical protein
LAGFSLATKEWGIQIIFQVLKGSGNFICFLTTAGTVNKDQIAQPWKKKLARISYLREMFGTSPIYVQYRVEFNQEMPQLLNPANHGNLFF